MQNSSGVPSFILTSLPGSAIALGNDFPDRLPSNQVLLALPVSVDLHAVPWRNTGVIIFSFQCHVPTRWQLLIPGGTDQANYSQIFT